MSGDPHHVHGAAPYPPPRGGGVIRPSGHGHTPPWGWVVGTANGTLSQVVVEHMGWVWLLWGRMGAVAVRSGRGGDTTDLKPVASSVQADGGLLGWWYPMATPSSANIEGGKREVVKPPKPYGEHNAKLVQGSCWHLRNLHHQFRTPSIRSFSRQPLPRGTARRIHRGGPFRVPRARAPQ